MMSYFLMFCQLFKSVTSYIIHECDVIKKVKLLFTFANSSLTFRVLRRIQLLQLECSCLPILRVTSSDGHEHVDGEPNEVDVACGFNTEHVRRCYH